MPISRRLRLTLRLLLAAAALVVLATAVLLTALGTPGFRRAILDRVGASLEAGSGIHMEARDFRLHPLERRLELDELRLRADATAEPFLTVEHGEALFRWTRLFGRRPRLEALALQDVVLDLRAPLPAAEPRPAPSGAGEPVVDLGSIQVLRGSVRSAEVAEGADIWLDRWRLDDLRLAGSYLDGGLAVVLDSGRLAVESHRRPRLEAELEGAGRRDAAGGARLESLRVEGTGLELTLAGRFRPDGAIEVEGGVDARLANLVPDLTSAGEVAGRMRLSTDASSIAGEVDARLEGLPAELLEPWLGRAALPALELEGSQVDGGVDLRLRASRGDSALAEPEGSVRIAWRRDAATLLEVEARTVEETAGPGRTLAFSAAALPGSPGRRQLSGELRVGEWGDAATFELRGARLDLETDDLRRSAAELGLGAELRDRLGLEGAVRVRLRGEGPLLGPRVEGEALWRDGGETLLRAALASPRASALGRSEVELRLALLPDAGGRRELGGRLRTAPDAGLEGTELLESRLLVESADAAALLNRLEARWPGLSAWWAPLRPFAEGELRLELRGSGPLLHPRLELDGRWEPSAGESLELAASGGVSAERPWLEGPLGISAEVTGLELDRFALAGEGGEPLGGRVSATLEVAGTPEEWRGGLRLESDRLGYAGGSVLEELRIEAEASERRLEIVSAAARLGDELGGGRFEASLDLALERPLSAAELRIELFEPAGRLAGVEAVLTLEGGTVRLQPLRLRLAEAGGEAPEIVFSGQVPLAALAPSVPALAALPIETAEGPVELRLEPLDLGPLWRWLGPVEDVGLNGVLEASLRLDPEAPAAAQGWLELERLELRGRETRAWSEEPLRLTVGEGRIALAPVRLRTRSTVEAQEIESELSMDGEVRLDSGWRAGDDWARLFGDLDFQLGGSVDTSLLSTALPGGFASGPAEVIVRLGGPITAPSGTILFSGPEAMAYFPPPYSLSFTEPEIEVRVERGRTVIERAEARLNRGTAILTGSRDQEQGLDLELTLEGTRLRLDHGLTVLLNADLALIWPPGSTGRLEGDVLVSRGSLRRDLQLDRELLTLLFGGPELESAEPGPLDDVRLDLSISTLDGVSIRNNLADIQVDWQTLEARGTIGQPLVRGRFEAAPGGRITAYGQAVRIDEAMLILSGDPEIEPRLILETTSSLEDPSLREDDRWYASNAWGDRGSWNTGMVEPGEGGGTEALTTGVANYYTERLASALGGALTGTEISYRSLQLFGEADTEARWTLSQRLSPRVTFVSSRNPREAEATTNLIEAHGFPALPGVVGQIFNDDRGAQGITLQQTRQLGGGLERQGKPLRRLRIEAPGGIPERQVRQASGYRRGDPVPEGADFDVEVDVQDFLRRNGFPGSRVRARVEDVGRGLVDLVVRIEPGPRVSSDFVGDAPSRAQRRAIAALYQAERLAEPAALAEMRRETKKALRSQGFLHPEVKIEVERISAERRLVRVESRGGRRVAPGPVAFEGVDAEVARELQSLFGTTLERVELAAATPGADAYLLRAMRRRGYPQAEIIERRISEDGALLTVRLAEGPAALIDSVRLSGLADEEAGRLLALVPLRPGDPLRAESVGRAVTAIESDLRARGFIDQRVEVELLEDEAGRQVEVVFEVETGASFRIGETRLAGLRQTDEEWAEEVLDLETGTVLTRAAIGAGRRRLQDTGIFRRVGTAIERPEAEGSPSPGGEPGRLEATVRYELEERSRYSVSYGARWDSDSRFGGAVYAADRNFLGRGRTLGVRAIWAGENERSLGVYHAWPRVGGSNRLLELFAEKRVEIDSGVIVDGVESWAQITVPLSPRRHTRFYGLLQDRSFELRDETLGAPDEDTRQLFLGWQYVFDSRDRALGVTSPRGVFLGFDVSAASDSLGSDFNELRLFAQGSLYQPLSREPLHSRAEGALSWAQSVRIGWQEPFGGVIPVVDRLTAGGEFSVRGYRRDGLGPLDEEGRPLGGELFLILNHELHLPLWGALRGVAFFDAGNVWRTTAALDSELFTAIGVGLRWGSPVGPLRLDLAHPLDRRPGIDPEYRVYFGFGSTF